MLIFGGNGHCTERLAAARLAGADLELLDAPYPGFEGRAPAPSLPAFLDALAAPPFGTRLAYATGVGGLLALALRARGALADVPLVLQAPVLWGLRRRRFPRLMRLAPARALVGFALGRRTVQACFLRRHLRRAPDPTMVRAFAHGYRRCAAFGDLFRWIDGDWLDALARDLRARPGACARITVWWGDLDRVVTPDELVPTAAALGVEWPLRRFPKWGHYPMLDDPDGWCREIRDALAAA